MRQARSVQIFERFGLTLSGVHGPARPFAFPLFFCLIGGEIIVFYINQIDLLMRLWEKSPGMDRGGTCD